MKAVVEFCEELQLETLFPWAVQRPLCSEVDDIMGNFEREHIEEYSNEEDNA